jgi:hypothetical protein
MGKANCIGAPARAHQSSFGFDDVNIPCMSHFAIVDGLV